MRLWRPWVGLAAVVFAVGACGPTDTAPTTAGSPTPTPDIEATVVAEVQARLRSTVGLTPTPASLAPAARRAIETFATSHAQIVRDREQFHIDFDAWRQGLAPCAPSSVEVTLRRFAATIDSVATKARALPRSAGVAELADKLIDATENEAEAVRQLRDAWQPDDPTVFEAVDTERSTAQTLRREVQDALSTLQERTTPESRSRARDFAIAVNQINSGWDDFRRNYDSFRGQEGQLTSAETFTRLGQLVDELREIVKAFRELSTDESTREVFQILAEAAEAEELALRRLRSTFQRDGDISGATPGTDEGLLEGPPGSATFTPSDATLFDAFEAQLVENSALRRQAAQELADLTEETSEEAGTAVGSFAREYDLLIRQWDQFHTDYAEWSRTEGGCDRSMAVETLGQFVSDYTALTRRARELPGGTLLGTLRELLVEASELEGEGLRGLRDNWRPFDVEVYGSFDGRRTSAAKLLRQVAVGLDSILAQHGTPSPQQ